MTPEPMRYLPFRPLIGRTTWRVWLATLRPDGPPVRQWNAVVTTYTPREAVMTVAHIHWAEERPVTEPHVWIVEPLTHEE